jgi:excisionase family DNA binding protein
MTRTTMEALLLPIPDACRTLGIGRSKLYELISAGEIGVRKIGRRTLVPCADITAFVARLSQVSDDKAGS